MSLHPKSIRCLKESEEQLTFEGVTVTFFGILPKDLAYILCSSKRLEIQEQMECSQDTPAIFFT